MKLLNLLLLLWLPAIHSFAQTTFTLNEHHLELPVPILFETGSEKIKPESITALQHIKNYLNEKSYISLLRIEVHTDGDGDEMANQKLSEKRALSVGKWLVNEGIDCLRIICVGFGSNKPVASNATPEGKSKNRRVEAVNAALKGRPIGGMPVDGGGKVAGDVCK